MDFNSAPLSQGQQFTASGPGQPTSSSYQSSNGPVIKREGQAEPVNGLQSIQEYSATNSEWMPAMNPSSLQGALHQVAPPSTPGN